MSQATGALLWRPACVASWWRQCLASCAGGCFLLCVGGDARESDIWGLAWSNGRQCNELDGWALKCLHSIGRARVVDQGACWVEPNTWRQQGAVHVAGDGLRCHAKQAWCQALTKDWSPEQQKLQAPPWAVQPALIRYTDTAQIGWKVDAMIPRLLHRLHVLPFYSTRPGTAATLCCRSTHMPRHCSHAVLPSCGTFPGTAAMLCCHSLLPWHATTIDSPTAPSSLSQMVCTLQPKRASILATSFTSICSMSVLVHFAMYCLHTSNPRSEKLVKYWGSPAAKLQADINCLQSSRVLRHKNQQGKVATKQQADVSCLRTGVLPAKPAKQWEGALPSADG